MTFVKKMKIGYESLSGGCVVRGVMCVVRCVVNKFIISKNTNRMQQLHLHYQQNTNRMQQLHLHPLRGVKAI